MSLALSEQPLITIVVPSFNQGQFLESALESIFSQCFSVEVFVMDGGSNDASLDVIKRWESKLSGWRSHKDNGQAAAINEGIANGSAEFVLWLNSDDLLVPGALKRMYEALKLCETSPFVYGKATNVNEIGVKRSSYLTFGFNRWLFANYCFVCQPATLIRRKCWEQLGGLNEELQMALDYDLWWRLINSFGPPRYLKERCAANRVHQETKTQNRVDEHYKESINVVKKHYGSVPLKWVLLLPIMKIIRKIQNYRLQK